MSILESLIYGLVSGLTEFLPVSSAGHQAILLQLFGADHRDPILDIFVHLAILVALFVGCKSLFLRIRRTQLIAARSRRKRTYELKGMYDLRLVKTATVPMLLMFLLYLLMRRYEYRPLYLALFFVVNGVILIIPEYVRHGNKNARLMSGVDSILVGLFGGLAGFPGVSRVGASVGYSVMRGADRSQALNWSFLLTLPAMILLLIFDVIHIFTVGTNPATFITVLGYFVSAGGAFIGGFMGISAVKFLSEKIGFAGFAYYSWGAAMFSFVLFLIA